MKLKITTAIISILVVSLSSWALIGNVSNRKDITDEAPVSASSELDSSSDDNGAKLNSENYDINGIEIGNHGDNDNNVGNPNSYVSGDVLKSMSKLGKSHRGSVSVSRNRSASVGGSVSVSRNKSASVGGSVSVSRNRSASVGGSVDVSRNKSASVGGSVGVSHDESANVGGSVGVSHNGSDNITNKSSKPISNHDNYREAISRLGVGFDDFVREYPEFLDFLKQNPEIAKHMSEDYHFAKKIMYNNDFKNRVLNDVDFRKKLISSGFREELINKDNNFKPQENQQEIKP